MILIVDQQPNCTRCEVVFDTWSTYRRHIEDSPRHHICDACHLDFGTSELLRVHWIQSPRHDYCKYCNKHVEDVGEHYRASHRYCPICPQVFTWNAIGLHEHFRDSEYHKDLYCVECKKLFTSTSNLNAHLNSAAHKSKDVKCPFNGCGASFVSRSALVLHFENGACRSGLTRAAVDEYVRMYDRNNLITDPSRMIAGPSGNTEMIRMIATELSWSRVKQAWECCLCHSAFRSLDALNRHLASPRHQQSMYICPGGDCCRRFTTLSGLVQHYESNKCDISRCRFVRDRLDGVIGKMGRLTL